MSEIQCVTQGLFGELHQGLLHIEELLLPGAEAERQDALQTLEEASTKHYL